MQAVEQLPVEGLLQMGAVIGALAVVDWLAHKYTRLDSNRLVSKVIRGIETIGGIYMMTSNPDYWLAGAGVFCIINGLSRIMSDHGQIPGSAHTMDGE